MGSMGSYARLFGSRLTREEPASTGPLPMPTEESTLTSSKETAAAGFGESAMKPMCLNDDLEVHDRKEATYEREVRSNMSKLEGGDDPQH